MIYIAWASMLAGFLFRKNSTITLSVTAILAGIALLVAHLSWMDPEITNLVPVLKSYWLTIHVATITASYGFLALGSLMAFLNLGIMIFRTKKNIQRIDLTILELTNIIEMSLLVGLVLLTIGNFLGGIWANESWGRYWGWDPKETWSLVTIIIYAFVLHLRLIPGLRSVYAFNFTAMVAFSSVIMTYFGVNYYLSGLHSYAKGDPVPIPDFVYYTVFVVIVISLLAAYNEMKLKGEEQTLKDP
jgi:cytochrome c-type biogenesis protein CcsB